MRCPTFAAEHMGVAVIAKWRSRPGTVFDNFNTGGLKDGKWLRA